MKERYKTRQELAIELGISVKTLSRKLAAMSIVLPKGLIPPKTYNEVLRQLSQTISQIKIRILRI